MRPVPGFESKLFLLLKKFADNDPDDDGGELASMVLEELYRAKDLSHRQYTLYLMNAFPYGDWFQDYEDVVRNNGKIEFS